MIEKYCGTCKKTLSVDKFGSNVSRKDGLQSMCKDCKKEYDKERYANNKDAYLRSNKEWAKRNREKFIEFKKTLSCKRCGDSRYYVLDFHHLDKKNKSFSISDKVSDYSLDSLLEECKKCIVLCANCHREIHYLDGSEQLMRL